MGPRMSSRILVAREAELGALLRALERATTGEPSVVLVVGEAGIGKSRLVRRLEEPATRDGAVVLHGESIDLEGGELPYGPIVAALRDVEPTSLQAALGDLTAEARAAVAQLLPAAGLVPAEEPPGGGEDGSAQTRLFESLLSVLTHLAREAPVLLVLEDLHWADQSTLNFVSFLVRALRRQRLALVLTLRDEDLVPELLPDAPPRSRRIRRLVPELERQERVERIDVPALTEDDVTRQIEGILGRAPDAGLAREVHQRSDGNPFHVEELLMARAAGAGSLPTSVQETVLVRVETLPAATRSTLALLAAFGRPVSHQILRDVGAVAEPALTTALHEGVAHHLLVREPGSDRVSFRHALARETVYQKALLPGERMELHGAIARALTASPDDDSPAELSHHWAAAQVWDAALTTSLEAAVAAQAVHAHEEALEHFERALEVWDRVAGTHETLGLDRAEVAARAAESAFLVARTARCTELWKEAIAAIDQEMDPDRAAWLLERFALCQPWEVTAALSAYEQASSRPVSPLRRARLLGHLAYGLTFAERWAEAAERAREALELAVRFGAESEETFARSTLGVALAFLGDTRAGEDELGRALDLARRGTSFENHRRVLLDLGEVLRLRGRVDEALQLMREGQELARRYGAEASVGRFMAANAAEDLYRLGRWDEAQRSLSALDGQELSPTAALLRESVAGRLAVAQGDAKAADAHLTRALELYTDDRPVEFVAPVRAALAERWLWEAASQPARLDRDRRARCLAAALEHAEQGLAAVGEAPDPLHAPVLFTAALRAHAEGDAGGGAGAETVLARLEALVDRYRAGERPPEAEANLASGRAEAARAAGRDAAALWDSAAAQRDALRQPYPAAYARWGLGHALLARGERRSAALEPLLRAYESATRLGAVPLRAAIEELARGARLDLTPRAAEPAGAGRKSEWGLTPREREVLELLTEGLTNPQIASRLFIANRTVGVHVSRILTKLEVGSRFEAAMKAQRHGISARTGDPVT